LPVAGLGVPLRATALTDIVAACAPVPDVASTAEKTMSDRVNMAV
jgi:hypothetical protein